MKTIGFDIGTTSISAVVYDAEKEKVIQSFTIANDSFLDSTNAWEKIQDPDRILAKSAGLLDSILKEEPEIRAIGLTGQTKRPWDSAKCHSGLRQRNAEEQPFAKNDGGGLCPAAHSVVRNRGSRLRGGDGRADRVPEASLGTLRRNMIGERRKTVCREALFRLKRLLNAQELP